MLHVTLTAAAAQDVAGQIDRYLAAEVGERAGRRTVFHGGGDTGFRSYLLRLPDDGIGVVLASNWEGTPREALVNGIVDVVLP